LNLCLLCHSFYEGKRKRKGQHEVIFLKKKKIPVSDKDTTNVNEQSINSTIKKVKVKWEKAGCDAHEFKQQAVNFVHHPIFLMQSISFSS